MNFKSTLICTALIGLCSFSAEAALWQKTATTGVSAGSTCNTFATTTLGNSCMITNTGASTATVTAWSNTGSGGAWSAAQLSNQNGSGFGVNNQKPSDAGEGGSPEHAVDNDGFVDAVRFQFGQSTTLSQVTTGWVGGTRILVNDLNGKAPNTTGYITTWGSAPSDADFTVLAWTGGTFNVNSSMGSLNATPIASSMAGWTVVGNYATTAQGTTNITTNVTSSFWLITAYNSAFGGTTANGLTNGNDFFKLLSVSGSTNTPSTRVSEPGALALAGLGLFGAAVVRRRRKQA